MSLHNVGIVLLLCTPALRAQPTQPASSSQTAIIADDRLRAWLATDPDIQEKITQAQNATPVFADPDLKDAVADRPADTAISQQLGCQDFKNCAVPPLALDIPAGEPVEPAIRAILRPWIWLADARGARLGVMPAGEEGEGVLAMNLKSLGLSGVELNIKPRPEGGVHLWFSRGLELATLYSREHDALLAARL